MGRYACINGPLLPKLKQIYSLILVLVSFLYCLSLGKSVGCYSLDIEANALLSFNSLFNLQMPKLPITEAALGLMNDPSSSLQFFKSVFCKWPTKQASHQLEDTLIVLLA